MRRWTINDLNKDLRKIQEQAIGVHLEKSLLGRVNTKCKGLEMKVYLACLRNNKKALRGEQDEEKSSRR